MYVYNDITTDARVQRAVDSFAVDYDLTLISIHKGKVIHDSNYRNILAGGHYKGFLNVFETILTTIRIIKEWKPDIVYCHDYYSAILAFILIQGGYSGKIVYDAHELIIPECGHKDRRLKFFYWFEKRIVKKVDLLICASEERAQIMKDHYDLTNLPVIIPNISQLQVDDDDKDVKPILESLGEFFADPRITVVYAGVVTKNRHLGVLLDAVHALYDQCKLLIVGKGDDLVTLQNRANSYPELQSAFTGAVPYKCLGSILSRCDIGFLYYPSDTLNNKYCASNKIYEYASVNLPMLANENPTVKKILENSQIGISTNVFKDGIEQIVKNGANYKFNCSVFTNNNKWSNEAEHLRKVIKSL